MTKIRKVKKGKKYRYNINRKRMNKKLLPVLESGTMQRVWNPHTSCQKNFKNLGLAFDINEDIKYLNREYNITMDCPKSNEANSSSIVKHLEQSAETTSNEKSFRFSQDQVNSIIYYLKKYGDDYKAMSRDKKNYLQQTWKQIRYKIKLFKSIPAHYKEYLKNIKN